MKKVQFCGVHRSFKESPFNVCRLWEFQNVGVMNTVEREVRRKKIGGQLYYWELYIICVQVLADEQNQIIFTSFRLHISMYF